jgi:hypothetical protein
VVQDHVNGDLLFAGTEFGVFVSVDGGRSWVPLRGGLPSIQVRDMQVQKRETDLVIATFGRGFYVLDDYSALREITPSTLAEEARLYPLRHAYSFNTTGLGPAGSAGIGTLSGNFQVANPPFGAVFTYHVRSALPEDTKLVLTIRNQAGQQVRRCEVDKAPGLRRVAWPLNTDPAPGAGGRGGGRTGGAPAAADTTPNPEEPAELQPCTGGAAAGRGGRGGGAGGRVPNGVYTATLSKLTGTRTTAVESPQTFQVLPVPQVP